LNAPAPSPTLPRLGAATSAADLARGLVLGAGSAFAIQLSGTGLGYLTQVLLARWLDAHDYGAYTYGLTWGTLLAGLACLGFPNAALRFVPQYAAQGDWARLRGFLRASGLGVLCGALAASAVGTLLVLLGRPWLSSPASAAPLLLGLWLTPLLALLTLQSDLCRALQRVVLAYVPGRLVRPLLTLAAGYLLLRAGRLSAVSALAALLVVLGLLGLLVLPLLRQRLPQELAGARAHMEWNTWLRVSSSFLVLDSLRVLLNHTDIVMLGLLREPADVGVYNAAARTAGLVSFVLIAANAVQAPAIAALHQRGERDALQRYLRWSIHLVLWPTLLLTGLLLSGSTAILGLFGAGFPRSGVPILAILTLGHLVNAAAGPAGYLLLMTGHHRRTTWIYALSAAANVALNALLIGRFGPAGAAVATSSILVLRNVLLLRLARRAVGVDPSILALLARSRVGPGAP
jgi:O-antigen/teichoic acid export membrane protein